MKDLNKQAQLIQEMNTRQLLDRFYTDNPYLIHLDHQFSYFENEVSNIFLECISNSGAIGYFNDCISIVSCNVNTTNNKLHTRLRIDVKKYKSYLTMKLIID